MKYLLLACSLSLLAVPFSVASEPDLVAKTEQMNKDLHFYTAELASDAYEGRAPATAGETKTIEYLSAQFARLGLEPGNNGSWYQEVPITSATTDPSAVISVRGTDIDLELAYGSDMMVATQQQLDSTKIRDSQLVFAGYGIVAPERNWNDYADIDVTGKTVVVLINDPGYATQDPELFNGNAMTYYGRWDYKYAEAARQGAAGVLIVHETSAASYPWEVVVNSWSGANIGLTASNKHRDKLLVEGWITLERAQALFTAAGMDYSKRKAAASRADFKADKMSDLRVDISLENTVSHSRSRNVLALLKGASHPDEVIIYSSHWDHLGVREHEGDNIYNGAADNASGLAAMLGLARLFTEQAVASQRSVLFLAVTAEESGLLGSKWYSQNPVYPASSTVANINMDNLAKAAIGKTRDVAVVGFGNSELEDYVADAAAVQGRVVVQEPAPEKGLYYRSDHFSFARVGIPALYLTTATDSVEHGKAWGDKRLADYYANDYHKPSDEYDPSWDLSGAAQDAMLLYEIGSALSTNRDFPNWRVGNEFKATRDASLDVSR